MLRTPQNTRDIFFMKHIMGLNITLWKQTFWEAWEELPLDQKAVWIFFITNTIAVITLIEMLAFH